ncbi:MAG: hypothetical protein AAGI51_09340 [Pseudomonadota bacterium]
MTQDAPFDDAAGAPPEDAALRREGSRLAQELVARVASDLRARAGTWRAASPQAVRGFCDAVLSDDPHAAETLLSALQAKGVAADALYSGYLADAARELGRRWDDDEIGFGEMSLGMSRLQRMLRELGPAFVGPPPLPGPGPAPARGLVAAAPGERHVFGAIMFSDHLRRLGWQMRTEISGDDAAIAAAALADPLDIVALSIACRANHGRLTSLISTLRAGPNAPRLIVVGGAFAKQAPALTADCGADLIASNAHQVETALKAVMAKEPRQTA